MRTHLFRGACAAGVVLALASSALAQSVVRGKVQDAQGKPVEGATSCSRPRAPTGKMQTKTDKKGEFLQVGLQSGAYKVTASKDGVGTADSKANVRQGPNNPLSFALAPPERLSAADKAAAQKLQALAGEAMAALKAGNNDDAIAKFNEVIAKVPTCADCYYNIGVAQAQQEGFRRGRGGVQEGHRAQARHRPTPTRAWPRSTTRRRSSTWPPRRAPRRRSTRRPAAAAAPRPPTTRA